MTSSTTRFYERARPLIAQAKDLPDFFTYHLTVETRSLRAAVAVSGLLRRVDRLAVYSLSSNLSNGSSPSSETLRRQFMVFFSRKRLDGTIRDSCLLGAAFSTVQTLPDRINKLEPPLPAAIKRDLCMKRSVAFQPVPIERRCHVLEPGGPPPSGSHMNENARLAAFDGDSI